ncbi:MAG TPA: D-amino acid aminotransferase [Steroidobacteraceae bacterium]|nr:D-amino acid aminotransferase [Steroidobacteraceae bacterium]
MADPLPIAYLNGEFLPLREARVSPLDRAFLYGDAVYEVMPVYAGRVFRFTEHFDRLDRSLREIQMEPVYERARWAQVCQELVKRNGAGDMYIYVQVTRGAEFGRNHAPLPRIERTVFCFAAPPVVPAPEKLERGVQAVTAADNRWARCDVKSTALLANVLLKQLAVDAGAHETIMLRDGMLREGSSTTVHVVIGGEIRTPPRSQQILPGTTRDVVGQLAARAGIPFRECEISEAELRSAEEVFIGAATFGTLAITTLDGKPVGTGAPGPVWKRVRALFEDYKRELAGKPIEES